MPKSILLFLSLLITSFSFSQTFKFNQYTTKEGIAQDFIYTINQSNDGYLWIGTGEGLSRYDGISFKNYTVKDGLAEDLITSSFKSKNGVMWYGHNNGGLTNYYKGQFFKKSHPKDLKSPINCIDEYKTNVVFVSQNDGVFMFDKDSLNSLGKFNQDLFYTIKVINEKLILVGTNSGLLALGLKGNKWVLQAESNQYEAISTIIIDDKNKIIAGTNNGDLLAVDVFNNTINLTPIHSFKISYPIKSIVADGENLWIATAGVGVYKLNNYYGKNYSINYYNQENGLSSNYIQCLFMDREKNVWIGSFGAGLLSLTDDYFLFYKNFKHKDIRSIYVNGLTKWFGSENGLMKMLPNDSIIIFDAQNKFIDEEVTSLKLINQTLWIGTYSKGLYKMDLETEKFIKINWDLGSMQNRINDLVVESNRIWVATDGGLIIYNVNDNTTDIYTTEDGLAHNSIRSIYKTNDGRILMGTYSRNLFVLENSSINEIEVVESGEMEILDFDEGKNDDIWFATGEHGVYRMTKDSIFSYTTFNGLNSNYCYAIEEDANGKIWVGHRNGISKINPLNNKISIYDYKDGITSQINKGALFLDENNYLWIGTEDGVIRYDGQKDLEKPIPPTVNFSLISINDKDYTNQDSIRLNYGTYRFYAEFSGIYFKNPDDIYYEYMMEGFDTEFSKPKKENSATYSKLQDGNYVFKVRAFSNQNQIYSNEIAVYITIESPFWKKWWFYILVLLAIIGLVYSFFWFKIQRLKKSKKIIEKQLEIKTKEVVESAKKIEIINNDLMSSINYALTLQNSILPSLDTLHQSLPNSFIYYKPRNVVSGDFYFINQTDQKLIFACVDCTGHGVPGAFMSLIAYVSLRDIYRANRLKFEWQTPEQILESLDKEVKDILGRNTSSKYSNNGMDIILCEYDLKTKKLLASSAKRPIVIQNEGEVKIFKGDKRSIGEKDFIKKIPFTLHQFNMKNNDSLFLFTDGFTDQFGGENNKKFGIRRTITTIQNSLSLDKKLQEKYIIEEFEIWKKGHQQTDDILFMGIYF